MFAEINIFYVEGAAILVGIITALGALWFFTRKPAPVVEEQAGEESEEQAEQPTITETTPVTKAGSRNRFFRGLQRSREALASSFSTIFGGQVDEEALEDLEDALLAADVGVQTAAELVGLLRKESKKETSPEELRQMLKQHLCQKIGQPVALQEVAEGPLVILVVGVNGSGKTTTIGKLSNRYKQQGKKVMVAAGDTFRAGAIDQLKVWADRAQVEFISAEPGADPGSVIYNALSAAKARDIDVVICDTAGRLQAQRMLMDELKKIVKVAGKVIPSAPHETLLVLDATIGQNALLQAEGFQQVSEVTGVVLTKLDGTAKGGVVITVRDKIGLPIKLVGLGEKIEDLQDFDTEAFVDALLNNTNGIGID